MDCSEKCKKEAMAQCLKDAGCEDTVIERFLEDFGSGRLKESIRILQKHRETLLDDLHRGQKRIDCLDYLIFMLQTKKAGFAVDRKSMWKKSACGKRPARSGNKKKDL